LKMGKFASFFKEATIDGCRTYALIALCFLILFLSIQIQDLFGMLLGD
jgi:hypothetical protein